MKDLDVGMYIRTKYGISKIEKIEEDQIHKTIWCTVDKAQYHSFLVRKQEILKASHNIIDLIEVGDYVNGRKVYQVGYNFADEFVLKMSESNYEDFIYPNEIETVVTKEQFESMSYKE